MIYVIVFLFEDFCIGRRENAELAHEAGTTREDWRLGDSCHTEQGFKYTET